MKRSRVDAVSPLRHYKWQHQVFLSAEAVGGQTFPRWNICFQWFAFICFCLQRRCSRRLLRQTPLSRPPSLFPWWARPRQACPCQEQPPPGKREMTACWSQTLIGWNHSSVAISFSCSDFSGLIRGFKMISWLQGLCRSVAGPSGLSGFSRGAKPATWQDQRTLHQPGGFL